MCKKKQLNPQNEIRRLSGQHISYFLKENLFIILTTTMIVE